jgi:hypothetical protein
MSAYYILEKAIKQAKKAKAPAEIIKMLGHIQDDPKRTDQYVNDSKQKQGARPVRHNK